MPGRARVGGRGVLRSGRRQDRCCLGCCEVVKDSASPACHTASLPCFACNSAHSRSFDLPLQPADATCRCDLPAASQLAGGLTRVWVLRDGHPLADVDGYIARVDALLDLAHLGVLPAPPEQARRLNTEVAHLWQAAATIRRCRGEVGRPGMRRCGPLGHTGHAPLANGSTCQSAFARPLPQPPFSSHLLPSAVDERPLVLGLRLLLLPLQISLLLQADRTRFLCEPTCVSRNSQMQRCSSEQLSRLCAACGARTTLCRPASRTKCLVPANRRLVLLPRPPNAPLCSGSSSSPAPPCATRRSA